MSLTGLVTNMSQPMESFFMGGLGALFATAILLAILLTIGIYVYSSIAWQTIAKKLKYKHSWLAWVPIARSAMILELGEFHWALIFLILIPILGWIALVVLSIIAMWRIFEKRKYPGYFSLSVLIPKVGAILLWIAIGFAAFKDKK